MTSKYLTTAHTDAIGEQLRDLQAEAHGTWTACSWKYVIGQLQAINLKGLLSADIPKLVEAADDRRKEFLAQLVAEIDADNGDSPATHFQLIYDLARATEWVEYGDACTAYLTRVEDYAQAAMEESLMLVDLVENQEFKSAAISASKISTLESIRASGKPVWKPLVDCALDALGALSLEWLPRVLIHRCGKLDPVLLGGDEPSGVVYSQRLYTASEWLAAGGEPNHPSVYALTPSGNVEAFGRPTATTYEVI